MALDWSRPVAMKRNPQVRGRIEAETLLSGRRRVTFPTGLGETTYNFDEAGTSRVDGAPSDHDLVNVGGDA